MNKIKRFIDLLLKGQLRGEFFRNVMISVSGTAAASLISFLLTPVVTRLFTPEDFGYSAFLVTMSVNLGLVSTLTFPQAFVLPRSRSVFYNLVNICLLLLAFNALVILVVLFLLKKPILNVFNMQELGNLIFLLPLFLVITELGRIAVNWNVRRKRFKENAWANVSNNLSMRLTQIGFGFAFAPTLFGLILGVLVGHLIRIGILTRKMVKEFLVQVRTLRISRLLKTAKDYKEYPTWFLGSTFISTISTSMPIYVLAAYYDAEVVGHFSFARALLNHPYTMLSASVVPVFFQRATELYNNGLEDLQQFTIRLYKRMLNLSALIFGALIFFSDWIFPFVFGDQWKTSGVFAGILSIYFVFRFVSVPMTPIYRVLRKEKYNFISSGFIFVFRSVAIFVGVINFDPITTVLLFTLAGVIPSIINIILIFWLLNMPFWKLLGRTFIVFGAAALFYGTIRKLLELWI